MAAAANDGWTTGVLSVLVSCCVEGTEADDVLPAAAATGTFCPFDVGTLALLPRRCRCCWWW